MLDVAARSGCVPVPRHGFGYVKGFDIVVLRPELTDMLAAAETLLAATGHAVALCPAPAREGEADVREAAE